MGDKLSAIYHNPNIRTSQHPTEDSIDYLLLQLEDSNEEVERAFKHELVKLAPETIVLSNIAYRLVQKIPQWYHFIEPGKLEELSYYAYEFAAVAEGMENVMGRIDFELVAYVSAKPVGRVPFISSLRARRKEREVQKLEQHIIADHTRSQIAASVKEKARLINFGIAHRN